MLLIKSAIKRLRSMGYSRLELSRELISRFIYDLVPKINSVPKFLTMIISKGCYTTSSFSTVAPCSSG